MRLRFTPVALAITGRTDIPIVVLAETAICRTRLSMEQAASPHGIGGEGGREQGVMTYARILHL